VINDDCRVEHNKNVGIHVTDSAIATIVNSEVVASVFRVDAGVDDAPHLVSASVSRIGPRA